LGTISRASPGVSEIDQPPEALRPLADVYADESSQNSHRYLVLGAMVIENAHVPAASAAIHETRAKYRLHEREIKWGRVSNGKAAGYHAIVDRFFELNAADTVHFHALTVDTSTFDHARYSDGDNEAGFNKLIYQLLLHKVAVPYGGTYRLEAYLDGRVTNQHPTDLRVMLNAAVARDHGMRDSPFRNVVFRSSKTSQFIQVCDLLIGAIAYRKNGHHLQPGANAAKCELAEYIARRAMRAQEVRITDRRATRFTLWQFRYRRR
jgi:hypothetical protein